MAKKGKLVERGLNNDEKEFFDDTNKRKSSSISDMKRDYEKVTMKLGKGEVPSREDLQLALDYRKKGSEGKNEVRSADLLYMAKKVDDPALAFEVAREINHHPDLQKIVFRDTKINAEYASNVGGADLRTAGKFASREFMRNPTESNLLALIKIANTSGSDFKKLTAVVAKYGDEDQKRMFADKVDRVGDADIGLASRKLNDSVVKDAKKQMKKNKQLGYDLVAKYVCDSKDESGLLRQLADLLFGTDEELMKMSISKSPLTRSKYKKLNTDKNSFLSNTEQSIKSIKLAKIEAGENQKFAEKYSELIEKRIEVEFDKFVKAQIAPYQSVLDGIRKMYPDEAAYQGYLDSLRATSAYKKAYAKFDKMYKEKKEELRITMPTKIKTDMENSAKAKARSAHKKKEATKNSGKEMVLGEE